MMQKQPLITIGITCFNAENSIERAVKSALAQDWPHFEIVIIDDCSTDNSIQIIERLQADTPLKIKIIVSFETNKGVAAARNEIIKQAEGEFIAFFDDDDISAPDRLTKQYERIVTYEKDYARNAPVICHTNRLQTYPNGSDRIEVTAGLNKENAPYGQAMADRILFGKPASNGFGSTATCSQMARKELYLALNGFDEAFPRCEDMEMNVRAALAGTHFVGIAEPLVHQKMTYGSDKGLQIEERCLLQLLKKHKDYINEKTSYVFCKKWTELKFTYLRGAKIKFAFGLIKLFLCHPVLTTQRLLWALPSRQLNKATSTFLKSKEEGAV